MRELKRALLVFVVFTLGTGLLYPFIVTGVSQLFFKDRASGSLVLKNGKVRGSALIGQKFVDARYFHGRPSANDYDATNSGGSNFGPANGKYLEEITKRATTVRAENGLQTDTALPSDLLLSSASGLDPEISLEGAFLQVARVARARGLSEDRIAAIVRTIAATGYWGGQARVNVLKLNLAIDQSQAQ